MIEATARGAWRDLEGKIRPFIARRVRSSTEVDDIVQDVFLRMQRGLPSLQDEQRFGPWVYQVVRSAIAEHHRAALRHPWTESDNGTEAGADSTRDEGREGDEAHEARDAVVHCIAPFVAALPPPYREAITLSELEGLTQRQAADMLGIGVSALKSRVQRGRAKLRAALHACCAIALDARGAVMECEPRGCACDPHDNRSA